jgi:endonuclease III
MPGRFKPNKAILKKIRYVLAQMHLFSKDAAVIRAEKATRGDPFKILVFTMLSARTKDDTTLKALCRLFAVADTPKRIAAIPRKELETILFGVGFYRVKAKHLHGLCEAISKSGGRVPDGIEGLLALPGVGRKTANIVLARAYGKKTLGVDVHVDRVSNRLGIARTEKPEQTEKVLVKTLPESVIPRLNLEFVAFGQTICTPRNPRCDICPLKRICFRIGVDAPCQGCAYGDKRSPKRIRAFQHCL